LRPRRKTGEDGEEREEDHMPCAKVHTSCLRVAIIVLEGSIRIDWNCVSSKTASD